MKNLLFFTFVLFFAVSCSTKKDNTETMTSDSTKMADNSMTVSNSATPDLPYTLEHPYKDWQNGDPQHAVNVMKALKAFQNNNIAESVSYFGDSVMFRFDTYNNKLTHDSLTAMFTKWRNANTKMDIAMEDWISVISKDKKTEWVTLWYKQTWTDTKGKTDSLAVVDDARIVNGKIVELDEGIRHLGKMTGM